MDRIFGSGFGSQKSSKPMPMETQLELVPVDNHLVDHLGNNVMRFLATVEVVRQRFGLADEGLHRAGSVACSTGRRERGQA